MKKKIKAFFYIFKNSAFKPLYYKDVLKAKFWFSLRYFLFLFFILSFLTSTTISVFLLQKGRPFIAQVKQTVPKFYPANLEVNIKNGQVKTNVSEPYFIPLDPELFPKELGQALKNQPIQNILVIDTQVEPSEIKKYQTFILLTKESVAFMADKGEIRIQSLQDIKDMTVNQKVVKDLWQQASPVLDKVIPFLIIILFLIIPPATIVGKFIYLVFLSFLTWIMALIFKAKKVNYPKALQINLQAITLPTVITALFQVLGAVPKIPFFQTIILLIFNLIIFTSIKPVQKKKLKPL